MMLKADGIRDIEGNIRAEQGFKARVFEILPNNCLRLTCMIPRHEELGGLKLRPRIWHVRGTVLVAFELLLERGKEARLSHARRIERGDERLHGFAWDSQRVDERHRELRDQTLGIGRLEELLLTLER